MQPTLYLGVAVIFLAWIQTTRNRVKWTWRFFVACQIFAATSVATLSALGGSSLGVTQMGELALLASVLFEVALVDPVATRRTLIAHGVGISLIIYAVIISYFGPRLFAGKVDLLGLRPVLLNGYAIATPLGPGTYNIIHTAYLSASFLTAIAVSGLFVRKLSAAEFTRTVLVVGVIHGIFGVIDALGLTVGLGRVLDFLKNASYTMVDQAINGVKRLSGEEPEPSSYASMALPFGVFATELWLRTRNRTAGWVGLFVLIMAVASTSSGGIFSVCVYLLTMVPRAVLAPGNFRAKAIGAGVLAALVVGVFALRAVNPAGFAAIEDLVATLTINKGSSDSARERGSWALQGWLAFKTSFGLGVGVGSFRSSSSVMAILGSLGVVGVVLMALYVGQLALAAAARIPDPTRKAAAWAAIFTLLPGVLGSSSADPGCIFAFFAGFALRPKMSAQTAPAAGAFVHARPLGRQR